MIFELEEARVLVQLLLLHTCLTAFLDSHNQCGSQQRSG